MRKITVVIADDESPAREELKHILDSIEGVRLVGEASDGREALNLVLEMKPDLIFLDIEMPEMNGIEVAKRLLEKRSPSKIIFATAYNSYAIKAFEVNAVDYILKPFDGERVNKSVRRVSQEIVSGAHMIKRLENILDDLSKEPGYMDKIPIKIKEKINLLEVKDIVYARAQGGLVFVYEGGKEHLSEFESLESLHSRLSPNEFLKTHRCYLVNIKSMKEILPIGNGHYKIRCKSRGADCVEVPLSRRRSKDLKQRLKF